MNMSPTKHERAELLRCAKSLRERGETKLAAVCYKVAMQEVSDIKTYDQAKTAYRAWLVFDEPRKNPVRKKRKIAVKRKATKKRIIARKKTVRRNPRRKSVVSGYRVASGKGGKAFHYIATFQNKQQAINYAKAFKKAYPAHHVRVMHG